MGSVGSDAARHVVFIPSAGMGHLNPFFRFITALASNRDIVDDVHISVVTVLSTVTEAEAQHFAALFAAFPRIRRVDFELLPLAADDPIFAAAGAVDPFVHRWECLRRSAHLLGPLIAGLTPRVSSVVTDITMVSEVIPIVKNVLRLPCHILFISCATMLSFVAYFPTYLDGANADHIASEAVVDVPAVRRLPRSWLPQVLTNPNNLFTRQFIANGRAIAEADGILVNTFEALEPEVLAALRDGKVIPGFPPVFTVGPLKSTETENSMDAKAVGPVMGWLDEQPARSVVYVGFGNRNVLTPEQIRELAAGLEASGCKFLWVIKTAKVDRDETAELSEVVGDEFLARVQGRHGLVTKDWVDQEAVLQHTAVGMYLSHSGWNSVTEAAVYGVPLMSWPRGGDQRVNATVVRGGGVGVWMEKWSWDGEEELVTGVEIGEKVKEVMADEAVKERAARVSEEAAKAVAMGGSSYINMQEFIAKI